MSQDKPAAPQRTLDVSHNDQLKVKPDYVEYSVKIETTRDDRKVAADEHAKKATEIEQLNFMGVTLVESSTIFAKVTGHTDKGKPFDMYTAITTVRYGSPFFPSIMKVNDASLKIGGSAVFNVVFKLSDTVPHYKNLLAKVGAAVKEKAVALAAAMEVKLGPALKIETGRQQEIYQQQQSDEAAAPRAAKYGVRSQSEQDSPTELSTTTMVPRDVILEATVQATYLLND